MDERNGPTEFMPGSHFLLRAGRLNCIRMSDGHLCRMSSVATGLFGYPTLARDASPFVTVTSCHRAPRFPNRERAFEESSIPGIAIPAQKGDLVLFDVRLRHREPRY